MGGGPRVLGRTLLVPPGLGGWEGGVDIVSHSFAQFRIVNKRIWALWAPGPPLALDHHDQDDDDYVVTT